MKSSTLSASRRARLVAGLLGLTLVGCTDFVERTRVVVFIDADGSVRERIDHVDVEVQSGSIDTAAWETRETRRLSPGDSDKAWPLSLTLDREPDDALEGFLVTATAVDETGATITQLRAISGYIRGRTLELSLRFDVECATRDAPCSDSFSCKRGVCIDPFVEAEALPVRPKDEGAPPREPIASASESAGGATSRGDPCATEGACASVSSPCATDHGGCDELVRCSSHGSEVRCGDCPQGFAGDGEQGCVPLLVAIDRESGELTPKLDPSVTDYVLELPLLQAQVELAFDVAPDVAIEIDGSQVERGQPWTSPVLRWGDNTVSVKLTMDGHQSRSYSLSLRRTVRELARLRPPAEAVGGGFGRSLAFAGDRLAVGAPFEAAQLEGGATANEAGAVYVYARREQEWRLEARLIAEDRVAGARFGDTLALAGEHLIAGARGDAAGAAYVFERAGEDWSLREVLRPDPDSGSAFGASLALEAERLVVGASGDGTGMDGDPREGGAVYVFERESSGAFVRRARVKAAVPGPSDYLGSSVALAGDRIASGATGKGVDGVVSGVVHLFRIENAAWHEAPPELVPSRLDQLAFFGEAVGIAGDTIAVGSGTGSLGTNPGRVYVFERSASGAFEERHVLSASNAIAGDYFGGQLLLGDDSLVVGASEESSAGEGAAAAASGTRENSGAVYVFGRDGDAWREVVRLKDAPAVAQDQFGHRLARAGDTLAVSAIGGNGSVVLFR